MLISFLISNSQTIRLIWVSKRCSRMRMRYVFLSTTCFFVLVLWFYWSLMYPIGYFIFGHCGKLQFITCYISCIAHKKGKIDWYTKYAFCPVNSSKSIFLDTTAFSCPSSGRIISNWQTPICTLRVDSWRAVAFCVAFRFADGELTYSRDSWLFNGASVAWRGGNHIRMGVNGMK